MQKQIHNVLCILWSLTTKGLSSSDFSHLDYIECMLCCCFENPILSQRQNSILHNLSHRDIFPLPNHCPSYPQWGYSDVHHLNSWHRPQQPDVMSDCLARELRSSQRVWGRFNPNLSGLAYPYTKSWSGTWLCASFPNSKKGADMPYGRLAIFLTQHNVLTPANQVLRIMLKAAIPTST